MVEAQPRKVVKLKKIPAYRQLKLFLLITVMSELFDHIQNVTTFGLFNKKNTRNLGLICRSDQSKGKVNTVS